ncbi:Aerotaxis receptor [Vibrio aerogenes CECT 7868]|uniref:Aerotaxis receptor n=1 Tax=Vibrio aerogenes CECT 7868 TaxID=1216006 RepID=A0A1M6DH67_9VIBR|nr:PAS domain-containing methyl-accepting chemotaxis protein [Vibrio aerogenes]SHI72481.1 Aerotaxis receptor [Vibrio aerogenes CECT 7868]
MRKRNQSILNEEVTFGKDEELVSTTDLRGVITYANEAFCRVAGYSFEELHRKNHNIVRHPDMPKAAFKDMWEHLQAGQPWRGAVKNRCKDGRYYWVDAFVTPIYENNQCIGYQSVRTLPDAKVKDRAEKLYARLNRGQPTAPLAMVKTIQFRSFAALLLIGAIIGLSTVAGLIADILIPLVFIGLFWPELFRQPKYEDQLKAQYDSVSRYVYSEHPDNIADFQLKMYEGKVRTILGRVTDSCQVMKQQAISLGDEAIASQSNVEQESMELESVSSSLEEMVASIEEVANSSATSSDQVQLASEQCHQAVGQVTQVSSVISSVVNNVEESTHSTQALSEKLDSINSLMAEIQGIAEQTNLLALNAAIEAARAGEQGRGFAVVADEVRSLSQRTHKTTESIQETMGQVTSALAELVKSMECSRQSAAGSIEAAEQTSQAIASLREIIGNISDASLQISTATEQQSVVAKEINVNVSKIRDASQNNLKGATLVAELSKDIREKSDRLSSMGRSFK